MKRYNFDESINRSLTNSYKWDIKNGEIPYTIADTDFKVADEIVESIKNRSEKACYGYTGVPQEYFDAYIYWWKHRHKLDLSSYHFVYSTSVVASIDCIIKRYSNSGDGIALFSPNYNVFYNCINNNNRKLLEVPFSYENYEYKIDFELLEKALKESKIFIFCNPHNPTGHIFSENEIKKISELCEKYQVLVISDEIHADIDYNQNRYVPFYRVSEYKNSVMLVSPSKVFNLAGLHSSVIVCKDKSIAEKLQKSVNEDDIGEPSYFSIDPVITAFTKCEEYVNEENDYLAENKRLLTEFCGKKDLKLHFIDCTATYLLWVDISHYSNESEAFTKALREKTGIVLACGKNYHEHYSSFVRINIATQKENIVKLCEGLKTFLKGE